MRQFQLRIFEKLIPNSSTGYINKCCEFCDLILNRIKLPISENLKVDLEKIVIEQEDWGWILEFQKNEVFYNLSFSYQGLDDENAYNFGLIIESEKLKKGFLFNRRIDAPKNCEDFAAVVEALLTKRFNYELFEEK